MSVQTAPSALAAVRELIDPPLASAVDRLCPDSRLVCGYHLGLHDADGNPVASRGGKALRPALVLLSARAAGGWAEDVLHGAVAVEIVHNWSILHDDVIDRDERRRHQPTAWTIFGEQRAILAADALLNLAWQELVESSSPVRTEALQRLNRAVGELIRGQQADLSLERRHDASVAECLDMSGAKTAALMSCATAMGALLAGGPSRLVDDLASFGWHLGLAFQGVDDILGIWGEPATTGKPAGNDLRQKKKTLPVVFALCGDQPERDALRRILSAEQVGAAEVGHASELLERSGARQWVTDLVERETAQALQALETPQIPDDPRAELQETAHFVTRRDG